MMALESLLSESQTSNLTQAQNELSAFTLIFFIILFVNMRQPRQLYPLRTFKFAYEAASMNLRK